MRPFNMIFWAILFVLSGIILLIRQFTPLNFSPFRVIIGVFVLLLGISILIGPNFAFTGSSGRDTIFSSGHVQMSGGGEHNCVFGQSTVDLSQETGGGHYEINCVFGQCDIILPANIPVNVRASAAFGAVDGPAFGSVNFGERTYTYEGDGQTITITVSAVFGQVSLRR